MPLIRKGTILYSLTTSADPTVFTVWTRFYTKLGDALLQTLMLRVHLTAGEGKEYLHIYRAAKDLTDITSNSYKAFTRRILIPSLLAVIERASGSKYLMSDEEVIKAEKNGLYVPTIKYYTISEPNSLYAVNTISLSQLQPSINTVVQNYNTNYIDVDITNMLSNVVPDMFSNKQKKSFPGDVHFYTQS